MNKTEFVAAIAEKAGLSKKDADKAVSALIETVTDALKNGDKIQLVGFGTFEVRERPERTGRNPRTKRDHHHSCNQGSGFQGWPGLQSSNF